MNTEDIKAMLDEWLSELHSYQAYVDNPEEHIGKWKRLSKKKSDDGTIHRVFINTGLNKKVLVVDDYIDGFYVEKDYVFHVYPKTSKLIPEVQSEIVICNLAYFKDTGALNDWHMSEIVHLPRGLWEDQEAYFTSVKSVEEVRAELLSFNLIESEEFSKFISGRV